MLSRPATKITLTTDDVLAYEQRKLARDAMREQHMDSSQDTQVTRGSDDGDMTNEVETPAAQTRAAKVKAARDQRIGLGASRA